MPAPRRTAEETKRAIVGAAIRLIGRGGIGAVTHRAVATEAGVSLSSTTYHFATKAEILAAALRSFADAEEVRAEREREHLRRLLAAGHGPSLTAFVDLLVDETGGHDAQRTRAAYELQLQAVDDPRLRPIARAWFDTAARPVADVLEALGSTQPDTDARLVVAAVDGLRLDALTTESTAGGERASRAAVERLVTLLISGYAPPAGSGP